LTHQNSIRLKRNLELSTNPLDGFGGNRIADIFKSFLRDIKNVIREQFEHFKQVNNLNSKLKILREAFYPLHIKLFVDQCFDSDLISMIQLYYN
jgi:hypothetical protein